MNRLDGVDKESKEHQICLWCFTGCQQIDARIRRHAPVIMFTISVNTGKWFFMQESAEFMTTSHTIHNIHQQCVVVDSETDFFKNRGTFELRRSHFIMT